MDVSVAAVRLAFIALPGLIASQIYRKLRGRRSKEAWETFFEVLIFSLLSYTLWILLTIGWSKFEGWIRVPAPRSVAIQITTAPTTGRLPATAPSDDRVATPLAAAIFDEKASPPWLELIPRTIAPSCAIGVLLALLASLLHNRNWVNRFARKIGVSRRSGDEDLWEQLLNDKITDEWLFVRDHKLNLVYFGHAALYSESQTQRELVMTNVSVFDGVDTSKALYVTEALYISRQNDDLSIELPPEAEHVEQTAKHDASSTPASDWGRDGEERRGETGGDNAEA